MTKRTILLVGSTLLALAGCANKFEAITPEIQASMLADLKAGKLNLDCGIKCDFTWIAQASSVHAYDVAEHWDDLAVHVMQIGYGNDLAYYYLGQAAQGLGYHQAAIGYYNYALALNGGQNALLQCASGRTESNDPCQGVDIAGSIPVLVQASRDALAQQVAAEEARSRPQPVVHHHHRSASSPTSANNDPGWVTPPPPPTGTQ